MVRVCVCGTAYRTSCAPHENWRGRKAHTGAFFCSEECLREAQLAFCRLLAERRSGRRPRTIRDKRAKNDKIERRER